MIDLAFNYEMLSYRESVPVRGSILTKNRFLKVTLLENDYYMSVLPGFHESSLEEIAFKVKSFFTNYTLNFREIDFSKNFFNLVTLDDYLKSIHPETLFNIEVLLLGMLKKSHPGLFNKNELMINELYRPALGPANYTHSKCLKIKIAPTSIDKTIRLINELHRINKTLLLRLDGNRQFELQDFITFTKTLEKNISPESFSKIDYIEEPFKNFADTFLFQKRSPLKIAMDESFSTYLYSEEKNFPENTPVVIKPSLFGISSIHNWMLTHPKNRTIISSSFEHPTVKIGLEFLASLRPTEFHGLENFL